ncbi:MAG: hypothetical protein JSR34_04440 [Proteobacteria bacterium]|nr:hypothetical protein [Pseudomonadota bacterium]
MRIGHFAFVLLAAPLAMNVQAAPDCSQKALPAALPLAATALPPLSDELPAASPRLGMADDVLGSGNGDGQDVDRVLARLRLDACRPGPAASPSANGYVPRTKWDNKPYRFNAGGNGKKFTAADFDAWMKANGIHVSTGIPKTGAAVEAENAAAPAPSATPAATPPPSSGQH